MTNPDNVGGLFLLVHHAESGGDEPRHSFHRGRGELYDAVAAAVFTDGPEDDDQREEVSGITDELIRTGWFRFEGDPPLQVIPVPELCRAAPAGGETCKDCGGLIVTACSYCLKTPDDGCGACGDGCASRGSCRAADESPAPAGSGEVEELVQKWREIAAATWAGFANDASNVNKSSANAYMHCADDLAALLRKLQQGADGVTKRTPEPDDGMDRISIKYTTDRKDGEPEGPAWWEWKRDQLNAEGWTMESECSDGAEIFVRAASQDQEGGKP